MPKLKPSKDFVDPTRGRIFTVRFIVSLVLMVVGIAWIAYYYIAVRPGDDGKAGSPAFMADWANWNYLIGFGLFFLGLLVAAHPSTPLGRGRGVVVGMLHNVLPFVVLPLTTNLVAQDPNLARAAEIMGARPSTIIWRVTIPQTLPAAVAGGLIAMILSFGSFITPALLGGRKDAMLGNIIDLFTRETLDWHMASVIAMVLLVITSLALIAARRIEAGR